MSVEYELINDDATSRYDTQLRSHDMEEIDGPSVLINKVAFRDVGVPHWTFTNVIMVRNTPTTQYPELIWTYDSNFLISSEQQGWVWNRGNNVYDVFVARSSGNFYTRQDLFFNTNDAKSYYPDVPLMLDDSHTYGFARVILQNGIWTIDPQYQYNIVEQGSSAPSHILSKNSQSLKRDNQNQILAEDIIPTDYALDQNSPNPFRELTVINYSMPEDSHVRMEIYNSIGQLVSVLVDSYQQAGFKSVTWDGRNSNGNRLPSGTYLCRLVTQDNAVLVRKMVLLQ